MENIIFVIGNVLLSFQPFEYLEKRYEKSVVEDLLIYVFSSDEWVELDNGTMMINDAKASLMNKYPHYKQEINDVLDHWVEMLVPINENTELVYQLKEKGYKLYLLSNFPKEAFEEVYKKYDFFKLFDGLVISAYIHACKPSKDIYLELIRKYQLHPLKSLFIDDMYGNIRAGNHFGIDGIHLSYGIHLKDELEKLKII